MNDLDTPNKRLRHAREAAGYDSAAAFAKAARVGEATYRHHENATGGRGIPASKLALYAELLEISVEWLLKGDNPLSQMQSKSSSRPGVAVVLKLILQEIINLELPVDIRTVEKSQNDKRERYIVPAAADNAAAMDMPDDSMSRIIPPEAEMLIDFDSRELVDGMPYLIKKGGDVLVRRFRETDVDRWFEADSFQRSIDSIPCNVVDSVLGRVVCLVKRF